MVGAIKRIESRSATWCRRLAIFALPYFFITILFHRLEKITSTQLVGLLGFGFLILAGSILLGIYAIIRIWSYGIGGGRRTIAGLLLSTTMMAPFLISAFLALRYPVLNDLSTNILSPPGFSEKTVTLRTNLGVSEGNDVGGGFGDDEVVSIINAYPNLSPRRYPAGSLRVVTAIKNIIAERGWDITDIRGMDEPAENDKKPTQPVTDKKQTKKSKKSKAVSVDDHGIEAIAVRDIYIDFVRSTLLFGFKDDVVIKIVSEEENTLVEMRSASRWGKHDFGANARAISKFLRDLDQNLIGIAGEG